MKNAVKFLLAILIVSLAAACTKDGETGLRLRFAEGPGMILKSTTAEGFTFSSAMIGVREFELKQEDEYFGEEEGTEVEIEYEGSYVVDLLAGTSDPDFSTVNIDPGVYDKFEVEFAPLLDGGKSVLITGSYTDIESTVFNFEFSSSDNLEFEVESEMGFPVDEGTILELLVMIDLNSIFSGVSFYQASTNEQGVIEINETSNIELYLYLVNNFAESCEMEDDHGDDDN